MAGKPELDAAIADLIAKLTAAVTSITTDVATVSTEITEATNMMNRLLAKISAGAPDLQSDIDQINGMSTTIVKAQASIDASTEALNSAIAVFKVQG